MHANLPPSFVDGPDFAADLARLGLSPSAVETLMAALQDLLFPDETRVSFSLGRDTDIRYVKTHDFPNLQIPPSYLTFRRESSILIELRRFVTVADVRAGFELGVEFL